jgi:hypothetical protein
MLVVLNVLELELFPLYLFKHDRELGGRYIS